MNIRIFNATRRIDAYIKDELLSSTQVTVFVSNFLPVGHEPDWFSSTHAEVVGSSFLPAEHVTLL